MNASPVRRDAPRLILASALSIFLAGCAREYGAHSESISPDGKHIIDVTEEIQAANDPDPRWQHISLRDASQAKPILPGNIAVISSRRAPKVSWNGSSEALVEINSSDWGVNFKLPPTEKIVDGIAVKFTVWKK